MFKNKEKVLFLLLLDGMTNRSIKKPVQTREDICHQEVGT